MHKLAKGLKKKKKKKDKKGADDDDFDPEELERYKRERAEALEKQLEASAESGGGGTNTANNDNSDEWKKFQALTAGVDSILKKTQGDLDRIKSTSFFQRKPVESEIKADPESSSDAKVASQTTKWLNFDKDGNPIEESDAENEDDERTKLEKAIVDIPDDDDEQEDSVDEDIFDTTYVDVLQNIDVQLAYIPDSPTQEELEDDPFDTTNADKVLKTVDKKTGKKLLSLGNAVEVLAGRIDHVSTCKIGRSRKQQSVDLLLDDSLATAEKAETISTIAEESAENVSKTLLDDDDDLPDIPVDLTKLPPVLPRPVTPVSTEVDGTTEKAETAALDLSEFEVLKEKTILEEIPDLEDDEFDLNAEVDEKIILNKTDDPFAEKEPENPILQDEIVEVSFEAKSTAEGEDPFDTTFAENILPGKTELKFIEKELEEYPISDVSISLTDPAGLKRDYETGLLKLTEYQVQSLPKKKNDLLAGSNTDLSQLADEPIAPIEEITYVDPFDTSAVQELPPGKIELKFLEKELLEDSATATHNKDLDSIEDDDFDPRKEESTVKTIQETVQFRKASRPEILELAPVKNVEFTLPTPTNRLDLLTTTDEEKNIPAKPLTPYYSQKSLDEGIPEEEEENEEIDPFDTNFVSKIAPGKTELKLLESELLTKGESVLPPANPKDPRAEAIAEVIAVTESINQNNISKRVEFATQRQESILDAEVDVVAKPLTPNIESKIIEEEEEISYKDPFDTSIAGNILPGKAELKILENELSQIEVKLPVLPNPLDLVVTLTEDDDFDPRAEEEKEVTDFLSLDDQSVGDKVLTPLQQATLTEDIDPFDTSFATIAPGKTELKLLESELVTK